jgi:hypothetical protein
MEDDTKEELLNAAKAEGIGVKATLYTLPRTGWGKTVFETVTYPFHAPQS